MYFLVDPIVLCLPDENTATSEEIENFIEHLIIWSNFIENKKDDNQFQFCITENCYMALYEENRYPNQSLMMNLINRRHDLVKSKKFCKNVAP